MSNIARITVTSCLLVRALEIHSLFYLLTFSLLMWYVHIVMRGRCWTAQAVLLTLAGDSQGFPLSPATSAELQGHSGESVDHPFCPQLLAAKIWKLLVIFIQKLPTTNYYTSCLEFPGQYHWWFTDLFTFKWHLKCISSRLPLTLPLLFAEWGNIYSPPVTTNSWHNSTFCVLKVCYDAQQFWLIVDFICDHCYLHVGQGLCQC